MKLSKFPGVFPIALLAGLAGCGSKGPGQVSAQAPPPTVEITQVAASDADIYVEYPAQTYARNMVDVRGRVEGYIEKWLFRPGQEVTAGQPLYILDLRPFQAQVQQAQGTLQQTQADLSFAQRQVSLRQAEANLAAAQSNLVKAQQDYDRLKPLVVESTQGKVEAQRGTLETAKLNVQYGTIAAPISGLIGDTLVPVGGLVNPNATQPLTTIVPLDPIWVRFKVSEAQYLAFQGKNGPVRQGPELHLLLADNSTFPQPGKVANTLNEVDPRTGTLEMQAEFPNPLHRLLPGQFGRVRYVAEHRTGVILAPQRAVQQNQSIQTVFVVGDGDKIEARGVKTGARIGDAWLIEQGLEPGDRVVVEGLLTVRPGMVVHPVPYKEKAAPAEPRKTN